MATELARIAGIAKARPKEQCTSLAHLINEESLKRCHRGKATGVDDMTKEDYEKNLDANLAERMKRQEYQPQPVRRVYIPKPGTSKQRPLGIGAYEDKLVDSRLAEILNAIYEADFLDCAYGFRCSEASCYSSRRKSCRQKSPITVVVISSDGKGDQSIESLEVKALRGWEKPGLIRHGRASKLAGRNEGKPVKPRNACPA